VKPTNIVTEAFFTEPLAEDSKGSGASLVERAQTGSRVAFRDLVIEHQGQIFATILRIGRDREIAEDLTQETFIKAWQNLNKFPGDSKFTTWLTRIAINLTLSWKKKNKNKFQNTNGSELTASSNSSTRLKLYQDYCLENAIEKLSTKQQQVIILFYYEKLGYQEIADLLQIPIGTVSSRLTSAQRKLRKLLSGVI